MANGPNRPHKTPDYRARVGGPGAASARTDLQGNQPIRVPTGLPYGEAGRLRTMQDMARLPEANQGVGGGGGGQGSPPLPADPAMGMREAIDAVAGMPMAPTAREVSAHEAALALEMLMDELGTTVSAGLMDLVIRLKREAMNEPYIPEADPDMLRGLDDLDMPDEEGDLMADVAAIDRQPLDLDDEEIGDMSTTMPVSQGQPPAATEGVPTPEA